MKGFLVVLFIVFMFLYLWRGAKSHNESYAWFCFLMGSLSGIYAMLNHVGVEIMDVKGQLEHIDEKLEPVDEKLENLKIDEGDIYEHRRLKNGTETTI